MKPGKNKQILAMGGGGFTMEPGNPLLDEYVLSRSPKKKTTHLFSSYCQWGLQRLHPGFLRLFFLPGLLPLSPGIIRTSHR
jgi:dipeptidase E